MSEMRVGVRNLKARLSEYLRQVRRGQVIVITDHGKAVGRILPSETDLDELVKTHACLNGMLGAREAKNIYLY
ncbi:MAG: type II toxin-antitoxin system prevent-host-death family antitoxin [Anaerolineales bacterium]